MQWTQLFIADQLLTFPLAPSKSINHNFGEWSLIPINFVCHGPGPTQLFVNDLCNSSILSYCLSNLCVLGSQGVTNQNLKSLSRFMSFGNTFS